MRTLTKIISLLAATFFAAAGIKAAKAADVSVEIMSTDKNAVLDTKVSGTICGKVGYFARNLTNVDYTSEPGSQVSSFSLADMIYPLGKGFDIVAELQLPSGAQADPRLGVQYIKEIGKGGSAYFLATRNFSEEPNTETLLILDYSRTLDDNWSLRTGLEHVLNISDKGYNFDWQKFRLGLENKGFGFGAAVESSSLYSGNPEIRLGGFISKKF